MSINLNSRVVADTRFQAVHGLRAAGAYCLQLSLTLQVQNWPEQEGPPPAVWLRDAPVFLDGQPALLLGFARPETTVPFRVFAHAHSTGVLYSLLLTPEALEAAESRRGGGGVVLLMRVQAEIAVGANVNAVVDEVRCIVSQSDWLRGLEQMGHGRTLLFEVPVPEALGAEGHLVMAALSAARRALIEGRYMESVAACRTALEGLTQSLGQSDELRRVREVTGSEKRGLTVLDRELRLRSAALEYAHLAHHPAEMNPDCAYDRADAQMMLGITASLASTAYGRKVATVES